MSDEELSVECGEHGKSPATFVCQHLPAGENQGFNVGYDPEAPDDAYPDAWCDQCDAVLEQEGEEEATDFILAALIEYRQWATETDDEAAALAWIESPQFQADYVAASQALASSSD